MRKMKNRLMQGFTLIEMLLVMVIVSGIIVIAGNYMQQRTLSLRIDRTSGQMQQILNAGLAYYVANGSWPSSLSALQPTYIPNAFKSPWNSNYQITATGDLLYVSVSLPATMTGVTNIAKSISGTLPLSFIATSIPGGTTAPTAVDNCIATGCHVVAGVNIPSQNLNNASSISYAGFYHSGACVPAGTCPSNYEVQLMAIPVQVNGFYDAPDASSSPCNPTDTSGCQMNYKPLDGFVAYTSNSTATDLSGGSGPPACGESGTPQDCYSEVNSSGSGTEITSGSYFRVCLGVTTSSGEITPTGSAATANAWGQLTGTILVLRRCVPTGEDPGSDLTVWMPSS